MFVKLKAIREITHCVTAREAVKTIDQANTQLALQVNALTGLADHFMQQDVDKFGENYLQILGGKYW